VRKLFIPRKKVRTDDPKLADDILINMRAIENWANNLRSVDVPFSYPGVLAALTVGEYEPSDNCDLKRIVFRLRVAGTTNTVLQLYKNGVSLGIPGVITVPSGATRYVKTYPSAAMIHLLGDNDGKATPDGLRMDITSAGIGAADMTGHMRFV
jgi:hypothetical protein